MLSLNFFQFLKSAYLELAFKLLEFKHFNSLGVLTEFLSLPRLIFLLFIRGLNDLFSLLREILLSLTEGLQRARIAGVTGAL